MVRVRVAISVIYMESGKHRAISQEKGYYSGLEIRKRAGKNNFMYEP